MSNFLDGVKDINCSGSSSDFIENVRKGCMNMFPKCPDDGTMEFVLGLIREFPTITLIRSNLDSLTKWANPGSFVEVLVDDKGKVGDVTDYVWKQLDTTFGECYVGPEPHVYASVVEEDINLLKAAYPAAVEYIIYRR